MPTPAGGPSLGSSFQLLYPLSQPIQLYSATKARMDGLASLICTLRLVIPAFWKSQTDLLIKQLKFLTTDIWSITFLAGGVHPVPPKSISKPDQDCVVLLSGGLDSLIGTINLMNADRKVPYAVSQISRGDKHTQTFFASMIGGGLKHLQLNHNFRSPGQNELSPACPIIYLFRLWRTRGYGSRSLSRWRRRYTLCLRERFYFP